MASKTIKDFFGPGRTFNVELLRYLGPGFLVTVGFIDPGNWATNIAGGSEFNYSLLWVISLSTLMLIFLQHMSAHLGIVTGTCLAESCRMWFPKSANYLLGGSIMLACVATALAEFLGAAIGFTILFGLPLRVSAIIAGFIILSLVTVQKYDQIEHLIISFVSIIGFCYLLELYLVSPDWGEAVKASVVPKISSSEIFIAMGMLGAVVMPHNIYLHSEVIQRRNWKAVTEERKRQLLRYEFTDTLLAMGTGWMINSAMVIVAAAVFFKNGVLVTDINQAAETLRPLAGTLAELVFAVALICAGISSSITACLAGGTVFTGYLGKEIDPQKTWFRGGVFLTAVPAIIIIMFLGDTYKALIWSQVILSMQLPLTIIPLIILTRSRKVMGVYANGRFENLLLYVCGGIIISLNVLLLLSFFGVDFSMLK
ncbi:MAG: Nramp family divalent metal transporter [Deltaproteobacteria bacterium]|nr:Nramp family divalent metal transporter [Deltaproteobacteria bacterium]